jgi:hypothetical protein
MRDEGLRSPTGALSAFPDDPPPARPAALSPHRVDIDGGGVVGVPDRDPITGPPGVLLCGGGGAEAVDFGAFVGCGWLGAGSGEGECAAEDEAVCASLMAPPLGRSTGEVPPGIGAPLGRSESVGPVAVRPVSDGLVPVEAGLFASGPGGWPTVPPQAAQVV